MNNRFIIRIEHPLVRPGLTIETEASERYVVAVTSRLLDVARELNALSAAAVSLPGDEQL